MTVLSIAYPFAKVSENTAGGAEQVLRLLDAAVTKAGWRSVVVARNGSEVSGSLSATFMGDNYWEQKEQIHYLHKLNAEKAVREVEPDVIHMHGIDFLKYMPQSKLPILITLHLPAEWYPAGSLNIHDAAVYYNCVSSSQEGDFPRLASYFPPVINGVEVEKFSYKEKKKDYALCLGRICPEKGYHLAIKAAKKAGIPLILAGEVYNYPDHVNYFRDLIMPELDDENYKFIGPANFRMKNKLLSEASCVLIPSLVKETSSLAAMESMACGTPVIGFNIGALSEIIKHGETGFLADNPEEMTAYIKDIGQISSGRCREEAEKKYTSKKMVEKYFELYETLKGGGFGTHPH